MSERFAETGFKAGIRRAAKLVPLLGITLAVIVAAPVSFDHGNFALKSTFAGNHGGNGNQSESGKANQAGNASGQRSKAGNHGDGAADLADAIGVEGRGDLLPVDTDTVPVNIEVIKEIAGLPDDSSLSEQEELEAITNGWGNWRTADGPNTNAIQ